MEPMGKPSALQMKSSLTQQQLAVLQSEFEKKKRSTGIAYVILVLVGVFGGHHFYLGKKGTGILYLLSFGLLGFGVFLDLFTLPKQVQKANERIEFDILQSMATTAPTPPTPASP